METQSARGNRGRWARGLAALAMSAVSPVPFAQPAGAAEREPVMRAPLTVSLMPPAAAENGLPKAGASPALRSRRVEVDLGRAAGVDARAGDTVLFGLFDNVVCEGMIGSVVKRSPSRFSWSGRLAGGDGGRFAIVVEGSSAAANIARGPQLYEVRPSPEGSHVLRQIARDGSAYCGTCESHRIMTPRPEKSAPVTPESSESASVVDVLVVYTPAARLQAGGEEAIRAVIRLAMDEANAVCANSEVSHRYRLVGRREVQYEQGGELYQEDLSRLTEPGDGYMDDVHTWREETGADTVALFRRDPEQGGVVGLAWLTREVWHDPWAFSVVTWDWSAKPGWWVLGHELGHNLGSGHSQPGVDCPSYAHGHDFLGDGGTHWGTLMVNGYDRIQQYSNPDLIWDGQPTGVATGLANDADNRLNFTETAPVIAAYRPALKDNVWVDFSYRGTQEGTFEKPYILLSYALQKVVWGATVNIKPSSSYERLMITNEVLLRAVDGSAIIGRLR